MEPLAVCAALDGAERVDEMMGSLAASTREVLGKPHMNGVVWQPNWIWVIYE